MRIPANAESGRTNPKTSRRIGCPIGTDILFTRRPNNHTIAADVWSKNPKRHLASIVSIAGLQFKMPGRLKGSKRRGKNASNLQAAAVLAINYKQPSRPAQVLSSQLGRYASNASACDVCGKDVRSCKGTGPAYARLRKRYTAMTFIG